MIGHGFAVVEAARPGGTPPTLFGAGRAQRGRTGDSARRRRRPTYAPAVTTLALLLSMVGAALAAHLV